MEKRVDKTAVGPGLCICGHVYEDHHDPEDGGNLRPECMLSACNCAAYSTAPGQALGDQGAVAQVPLPDDPTHVPELAHRPPHLTPLRSPSGAGKAARQKPREAPEPLKKALRDQLVLILDKPIGPKMLKELAKTAMLSQKLIITAGDPNAMPRRARGMGMSANYGLGADAVFDGDDDMGFDGPGMIASPVETFGASAIRELVAATKEKNKPGVVELTKALGIAKKEGLDEVAADLQRQLLEKPHLEQRDGGEFKPEHTLVPTPEETPVAIDLDGVDERIAGPSIDDNGDVVDLGPEGGAA